MPSNAYHRCFLKKLLHLYFQLTGDNFFFVDSTRSNKYFAPVLWKHVTGHSRIYSEADKSLRAIAIVNYKYPSSLRIEYRHNTAIFLPRDPSPMSYCPQVLQYTKGFACLAGMETRTIIVWNPRKCKL